MKKILLTILFIFLMTNVAFALRITKPQRITDYDENGLVIINDVFEKFWHILNGRYSPEVAVTTFTIYDDGDWDNEAVPIFIAPKNEDLTIVKVVAAVMGTSSPALSYNIEEREWGSLNSAGTDIYAVDQSADENGEIETSFSNADIETESHLIFTTGSGAETGTVTLITGAVYFE
jgi:hypothetical protein